MLSRRRLLTASLPMLWSGSAAWAQQRASIRDALRFGVDQALFDSGLATSLLHGFGRDTRIAVKLVRSPALTVLEALERGELDVALTNVPEAESRLENQGLLHDRRAVATGDFVIIGPAVRVKGQDVAGIAGGRNAAEALSRLRDAALATPGAITFLSAADGSGAHAVEQAVWRQARIAPAAPWYAVADSHAGLIAQARARRAYALVERGAWLAQGGAPLALLVEGDPRLREAVHVMRAFRSYHPAAKIFLAWVTGPKGRSVVAGRRGYRAGGA